MSTLDERVDKDTPLVTVIMPHWEKSLPYIGEAIDSIAAQTFLDLVRSVDLRVVDDGSSVHEYEILSRVIKQYQETHRGRFVNFILHSFPRGGKNRNLERIKQYIDERSRYILVADSDDVFAPQFLTVLFEHLEQQRAIDPNVVISYCNSLLIDEHGFCCGAGTAPNFDRSTYFRETETEESNYIPGNALRVTERFMAGTPKDFDHNRDKHKRFVAELGEMGRASRVDGRHFFYKQHADQMSGHMDQLAEDQRYGPGGFFDQWPQGERRPYWREWLALQREEQTRLLSLMPNADTMGWQQYRPRPNRHLNA